MNQIVVVLSEYSVGFCWILGSIAVVFLGITLHRIKRIEQAVYRQTGEMKKAADEIDRQKMDMLKQEKQNMQEQHSPKAEERLTAETLLDAVIEEVFP